MTKPLGRRVALAASLALAAAACAPLPRPARDAVRALRVMSFNVRYDEPRDGANAWPRRKDLVAGTVAFHRVDVAGLQEVLATQLADLRELLPGYAAVGVGRDDGKEAGEFNPVLFRKDRFRLLGWSTFWLSEEPGNPGSKGWDAACARVVTWARLLDLWTGATLVAFNTHFDHVGDRARRESARLILSEVPRIAAGAPFVLTGDFNCTREDAAYLALVSGGGGGALLRDARDLAAPPPYEFTYALNTGTIRGQKLGLMAEIETTAKAGYQAIEPWLDAIHKFAESGGSLRDVRKRCEDLGLKVCSGIGFAAWPVSPERAKREAASFTAAWQSAKPGVGFLRLPRVGARPPRLPGFLRHGGLFQTMPP